MPRTQRSQVRHKKGPASRQAGFTLIEILIALAIIAVLVSVSIVILGGYREYARSSQARSYGATVATRVGRYAAAHPLVAPTIVIATLGFADGNCALGSSRTVPPLPSAPRGVTCAISGNPDWTFSVRTHAPGKPKKVYLNGQLQ